MSWESPPLDSLHGILKGYKVTYAVSHLFDDEQNREYKTTLANETVLHGLKKNRVYAIRVSATTAGGDGPKSPRIHCATETDGKIYLFVFVSVVYFFDLMAIKADSKY